MYRYEWNAIQTSQALTDLETAAVQVREFREQHPEARIACQILLDLPEPAPPSTDRQ